MTDKQWPLWVVETKRDGEDWKADNRTITPFEGLCRMSLANYPELPRRLRRCKLELQPLVDADREKIERLEKALRFYADEDNYSHYLAPHLNGLCDKGEIARQALGEDQ